MHLCTLVFIYSYIAFYIHISKYHLYIISFMHFYQDLTNHVLSIFLSYILLLIHIFISYTLIFIYFPIHASTVRCLYIVFHILFYITYSIMSLLCLSFIYMYLFLCFVIFYLSLSFLSFMPFYHVFLACSILFLSVCLSYINIILLIFICAYHSCTLDYHILSYLIILYSYHIYVFLFLYESTLLRNWNQSNRIIQTKVMAFSCQLVDLPITLGTVCITHFSGVLTSFLSLGLCNHLKLRC